MSLEKEIEDAARTVSTDAFSLTLGEIVNLYRDGDIIINPDFQRLFRWDIDRKSRLIESILVRIPLPSIFVFELPNRKWEIIDGLQRLSTILEFMGELRDPDTETKVFPRSLVGTQYLPSLKGAFWSDDLMDHQVTTDAARKAMQDETFVDVSGSYFVIDPDIQRGLKRAKIGVQLLDRRSDPKSKYDLFQRLNSGGMTANDQELRNCAIVMVNPKFFEMLKSVAASADFSKLIPLGLTSIRKSNDLDNICKIIGFSFKDYVLGTDIEEFVTNAMVAIASSETKVVEDIFSRFSDGLKMLIDSCGYNALRPYRNGVFAGRIGRTSIEIILVGLLKCLDNVKSKPDPLQFIRQTITEFWNSAESTRYSAAGIAGTDRVQYTIPLGISLFSK